VEKEKFIEEVEKMTVVEIAELVKAMEEKFGISAALPSAAHAPAEAAEEKTAFTVVLAGVGDKKIEVIKVVRDATQKGLKEAKDMVDAAATAPQVIKEGIKKEEAEDLKKKFEAAGAKVELK